MKVDRKKIEFFIKRIKSGKDIQDLSDEYLAEELSKFIELNPGCINLEETNFYSLTFPPKIGETVFHETHGKGSIKSTEGEKARIHFWLSDEERLIPIAELNHVPRFSFSTVGYGVFSLVGERYRMGRIEIFDGKNDNGFAVEEGFYCLPFVVSKQFESFIDALASDFPIHISIGSMDWCRKAVAEDLEIPIDKLGDQETIRDFYKKKNDAYAQLNYGMSWDEYSQSIFRNINPEDNKPS